MQNLGGAAAVNSNLRSILTKLAPQVRGRPREVMVAISNFNLVPGGQLPLWLKVCLKVLLSFAHALHPFSCSCHLIA